MEKTWTCKCADRGLIYIVRNWSGENVNLTLKMITTQEVETSVITTNSLSKDYSHPDDHARQTTDTPGFKPFTNVNSPLTNVVRLSPMNGHAPEPQGRNTKLRYL